MITLNRTITGYCSSAFFHNGEGLDIANRYQIIEIFHTEPEG